MKITPHSAAIRHRCIAAATLSLCLLGACANVQPLTEYRPVVDPQKTNMYKFEGDLNDCRALAVKMEADLKQRQTDQAMAGLLLGAVLGAAVGTAVGDPYGSEGRELGAGQGALAGAAAGLGDNPYTRDMVEFGPRRVVDRCLHERGHTILSDIGQA